MFKHRFLKNFKYYFLTTVFNLPLMIFIIAYIRFLYFYYLKKKFRSFYTLDNSVVKRNSNYINTNPLNLIKIYNVFSPRKKLPHLLPLKALFFLKTLDLNPYDMKVLSIGPRTESELFSLVTLGFQLKNIYGLDVHSYSPLIKLGDAANMPFKDDTFDLIVIGKMLVYTDEPNNVIKETIRVLKNNGTVSMYHSHMKDNYLSKFKFQSSNDVLDLFGNNLHNIYFKYHVFDRETKSLRGKSNIIVSIKK